MQLKYRRLHGEILSLLTDFETELSRRAGTGFWLASDWYEKRCFLVENALSDIEEVAAGRKSPVAVQGE